VTANTATTARTRPAPIQSALREIGICSPFLRE
jgi:hypothetical protein